MDSALRSQFRQLAETPFETPRLALEPLQVDHVDALFAGFSDPELYHFIPQEPPDRAALLIRFQRVCQRGPVDGEEVWLNWAIRLKTGGYAGLIEASAMSGGRVDLAYFVFTQFQNRGVAREAAAEIIRAVRTVVGVSSVGASIDTRNLASERLLRSLGFECVGTVKAADFFKGATSDEYRFELTLG